MKNYKTQFSKYPNIEGQNQKKKFNLKNHNKNKTELIQANPLNSWL
jgi:hypothetical protein